MAKFVLQVPVKGYELHEFEGDTLEDALEEANNPGIDLPDLYSLDTEMTGPFEPAPGF